jgi:hypothetical protein
MAGYKTEINNAWVALQVYPTSRVEVFANSTFNSGVSSITDFGYDAGALTGPLFGLDYPLHSSSMSGFSNLDIRRFSMTAGANVRVTDHLVVNGMLMYDDNADDEPWLYDSTGQYLNVYAGVSWIF